MCSSSEGKEKKIVATPLAANAKPSAPAAAASALPPSFVDFVLMPGTAEPAKAATALPATTPGPQPDLADAAALMPKVVNAAKTTSDALSGAQKTPEKKP